MSNNIEKTDSENIVSGEFRVIQSIMDGLSETLGENYELVLHDLKYPEKSLIYKVGNLTNRGVGAPITNLVVQELHKHGNNTKNMIGYINRMKDGRVFRSSTIFIRDKNNKIIGCLCTNIDITQIKKALQTIEGFYFNDIFEQRKETFPRDVSEILHIMIEETAAELSTNVPFVSKEENTNFIRALNEKGVFLIKGSVEFVAEYMSISKYTVYGYLSDVKNESSYEKGEIKVGEGN